MARDGGMTLAEADPVLAYLKEFRASFDAFRALVEKRLDRIEERLDKIEIRLDKVETHLAQHDSRFDTIEARISLLGMRVDRKLDKLRTELVSHMELLHLEINGRVADLEGPARGNGGGSTATN